MLADTLKNNCNYSKLAQERRDRQRGVQRLAHQYYTTAITPAKRMQQNVTEDTKKKEQLDSIRQAQFEYRKKQEENKSLQKIFSSIRNEKKH